MTQITIAGQVINRYLSNYNVDIQEQFDNSASFTAVSGKQVKEYIGDKRILNVDFEAMETAQINALFNAIKSHRDSIPITYIDPQKGNITLNFECPKLPSATWFESDDGRQFWTIPTVTFEELESSWKRGAGG